MSPGNAYTPRKGSTLIGGEFAEHEQTLPSSGLVLPSSPSPTLLFRWAPFPWICTGLETDVWKHVSRRTQVFLVLYSTVKAAESQKFTEKGVLQILKQKCPNQNWDLLESAWGNVRDFFFSSYSNLTLFLFCILSGVEGSILGLSGGGSSGQREHGIQSRTKKS